MMTFRHAGRMGDVLYSLYFATHFTRGEKFDYVLRTGVSAWDPSGRPHMMELTDAEFLKPLLEAQPYIHSVAIAQNPRIPGENYVLDSFRRDMRRVIGREIRTWYYPPRERIPDGEFSRPVLSIQDPCSKIEKIAVCFTPRYRQAFDLAPLRQYRDRLVFVGLPEEHRAFCERQFCIDFIPVLNALELLQIMSSCLGFIGNVSGTFAIAECAKIPRILCLAPDGGNVKPQGGFHRESASSIEFETQLNQLLEETL